MKINYNKTIAIFLTCCAFSMSDAVAAKDSRQIEAGAAVYQKWCAACHSEGENFAGTSALAAKYKGAIPSVLIQRTDLSPEFIQHFVRNGYSIMPFFRKTEINNEELQALTIFLTQKNKKQ